MSARTIVLSISCLMMTAISMSAANAERTTGKLQVKINIGGAGACEFANKGDSVLDFGTRSNFDKVITDGKTPHGSEIMIKCAKGTDYKIALDAGSNADPSNPGKRYMKGEKGSIEYTLY